MYGQTGVVQRRSEMVGINGSIQCAGSELSDIPAEARGLIRGAPDRPTPPEGDFLTPGGSTGLIRDTSVLETRVWRIQRPK